MGGDYVAEKLEGRQTVTMEELALSNAFQLEALINILEAKGLLKKEEILEEVTDEDLDFSFVTERAKQDRC